MMEAAFPLLIAAAAVVAFMLGNIWAGAGIGARILSGQEKRLMFRPQGWGGVSQLVDDLHLSYHERVELILGLYGGLDTPEARRLLHERLEEPGSLSDAPIEPPPITVNLRLSADAPIAPLRMRLLGERVRAAAAAALAGETVDIEEEPYVEAPAPQARPTAPAPRAARNRTRLLDL